MEAQVSLLLPRHSHALRWRPALHVSPPYICLFVCPFIHFFIHPFAPSSLHPITHAFIDICTCLNQPATNNTHHRSPWLQASALHPSLTSCRPPNAVSRVLIKRLSMHRQQDLKLIEAVTHGPVAAPLSPLLQAAAAGIFPPTCHALVPREL